jgi:hypothetical protein
MMTRIRSGSLTKGAGMTAMKVSRVRMGLGLVLAVVSTAGGVVALPKVALAAPWTVYDMSSGGVTAAQLASTLVGPGITVNSATFTGHPTAAGTFNDPAASVGLASGIVLSSGHVQDVIGPNKSGSTGVDLGTLGDTALDALSGQTTQDAASLTVHFTPTNPQMAINYVFSSEEYVEWVGSQFNDVFAFYVNGVNCALTPGTNNPITVNTINPGSNALFYVPNEPPIYDSEFDGFTVVLTCRAAVNPGIDNTLRLAIADASDGILDSAVFLQANGVSSNPIGPLQPITPNRLLDTRSQALTAGGSPGLPTQALVPGGTSINLKVTGGDVPETALAVALNVTAVDGVVPGFLTVYPSGGDKPGTSSVNYPAGAASPNTVVAKIGTGGQISIFSNASVNVIVDVFGWFGPGGNARLFTVVPNRLIDTRDAGVPVGSGQTIDVQVASTLRVPAGATAAILNVTAVDAIGPGYLTVYPSDRPQPLVSSVNYEAGVARPNSVISPIGADGKIKVFANNQAHVIVDVMGWFGPAGQAEYVEVPSTRVLDSRLPGGVKMTGGSTIHVQIVGPVVPPNARSVVLNVIATEPDLPGFLTVFPGNASRPLSSNVNYVKGQTIPNAVIVGLGPTGAVDIFSNASTHVVVDVVGYFA